MHLYVCVSVCVLVFVQLMWSRCNFSNLFPLLQEYEESAREHERPQSSIGGGGCGNTVEEEAASAADK